MTVAGCSRVYSEDITELLLVSIPQADSFNLTPLTSLWVNESDLEPDFPYHGRNRVQHCEKTIQQGEGKKIRMEWEKEGCF